MASSTPKRKTRAASSTSRASSLSQDAVKTAKRLTLQVLEGGKTKSLLAVRQADLAERPTGKKRRAKAGAPATAFRQVAPIGLKADVSEKLLKAAPAFGDVLRSIAHAVAVTQTALDETALESLKTLAGQQVQVPVLIEQTLNDDGEPDSVSIITAPMPLTSIITPSMQQVDQMTLRMDMRVESFNATSGIKFNQNIASAGVSYSGHSFGFAVAMNNTNINAQFSNMSDFSSGSVMMSMDIVDRTGFTIPKPLEYGIGANMLVRLMSIAQTPTQPDGFEREAIFSVKLVKVDGSVVDLTGYNPTLPAGLLPNTTTAGQLKIKRVCATAAEPYLERKVSITLGQLIKEMTFFI
jgi:hypothetical protein